MNKSIDKTQGALRVERALKLALEALESGKNHGVAIDVLRRALAEQSALDEDQAHYKKVIDDVQALFEAKREEAAIWQAAYETEKGFRQQEQPASKPWVGLTEDEIDFLELKYAPPIHPDFETDADHCYVLIKKTEAKLREKSAQPSKPLTDEQIAEIAAQGHQRWIEFARAIEAAHGIYAPSELKENE